MSFHSKGKMEIINDEGKKYIYEVETHGHGLTLYGDDGIWHYSSDRTEVLSKKLKEEINELKYQLKMKRETLKELMERRKNGRLGN